MPVKRRTVKRRTVKRRTVKRRTVKRRTRRNLRGGDYEYTDIESRGTLYDVDIGKYYVTETNDRPPEYLGRLKSIVPESYTYTNIFGKQMKRFKNLWVFLKDGESYYYDPSTAGNGTRYRTVKNPNPDVIPYSKKYRGYKNW
jgi:hypothetical protein